MAVDTLVVARAAPVEVVPAEQRPPAIPAVDTTVHRPSRPPRLLPGLLRM